MNTRNDSARKQTRKQWNLRKKLGRHERGTHESKAFTSLSKDRIRCANHAGVGEHARLTPPETSNCKYLQFRPWAWARPPWSPTDHVQRGTSETRSESHVQRVVTFRESITFLTSLTFLTFLRGQCRWQSLRSNNQSCFKNCILSNIFWSWI